MYLFQFFFFLKTKIYKIRIKKKAIHNIQQYQQNSVKGTGFTNQTMVFFLINIIVFFFTHIHFLNVMFFINHFAFICILYIKIFPNVIFK